MIIAFSAEKAIDFGIQNNQNIKVSFAKQGQLNAQLWVHGPCEPLFSFDPGLFYKYSKIPTYNTAVRHTDFRDNFLQLLISLEYNNPPKQLLLYVTPESFDEQFNAFHSYRYLPFDYLPKVDSVLKENDRSFLFYSKLPMLKYAVHNQFKTWKAIQGWKHYFEQKSKPYYATGYRSHETTAFTKAQSGYTAPGDLKFSNGVVATITEEGVFYQMYDADRPLTWSKRRAQDLQSIINLCQEKGIDLIFYESPVFYPLISKQPNRKKMLVQIDSISEHNNIPFLVFDELALCTDRSNFVSPLILSVKGTKVFTPILADRITSILEK